MFVALISLTILGGLALVAGFAWLMVKNAHFRRRSGPEVGAEVMGQIMDGQEPEEGLGASLAGGQVFRGTGTKLEGEVDVGYAEIKAALRAGRWRLALPSLLIMGGITALCAFGFLALFVRWENKLVGGLLAAVVWFTLVRIWLGFARA